MIQSMTGFGKASGQLSNKKITVEINSLNSKNLDVNARIPGAYREKELVFRNLIAERLQRGKVDFSLHIELNGETTSAKLNIPVVNEYIRQLALVDNSDRTELLKMAVRMPDALTTEREEIDEKEFNTITNLVNEALTAIETYRNDEGLALKTDFEHRIDNIKVLLERIIAIDPERVAAVKERLRKAVSDLKEDVDENRFEQELIYYLEKYDITEEKVRLSNHLSYFVDNLNSPDSNGKKLGFISQEIGREINTIGSKANYAPMQQMVVQMKDELEKIKEQLLNVL